MKNNKNINTCYVFSQATLELAIDEWLDEKCTSDSKNKEDYLIVVAAMPWFLKHLNQSASIYMFTDADLNEEMVHWKSLQEAEYPKQKKRIENTCNAIIDFFQSEIVHNHKMIIQA